MTERARKRERLDWIRRGEVGPSLGFSGSSPGISAPLIAPPGALVPFSPSAVTATLSRRVPLVR